MTVSAAFGIAATALSLLLVLMSLALVIAKLLQDRRSKRDHRLVEDIRPRVVATIDDPEGALAELSGLNSDVVEEVIISLLPKLRGSDRRELSSMLASRGVLSMAERRTESFSALRRQRAIELLGSAGGEQHVALLVDRLEDRDPRVRAAAARALGRIGSPTAVDALIAALEDRRLTANTATMALLRIGTPASEGLSRALWSPHPRVRSEAADLIGTLALADNAERLEQLLDDPMVRRSAARSLGRLGLPSSAPVLIAQLEAQLEMAPADSDTDFAAALASALGHIGHRSAIPVLTSALARSHRLSRSVAAALSAMGVRRPQASDRGRSATPALPAPLVDAPSAVTR